MIYSKDAVLILQLIKGEPAISVHSLEELPGMSFTARGSLVEGANLEVWPDLTDYQRFEALKQSLLRMISVHRSPDSLGSGCLQNTVLGYSEWAQSR